MTVRIPLEELRSYAREKLTEGVLTEEPHATYPSGNTSSTATRESLASDRKNVAADEEPVESRKSESVDLHTMWIYAQRSREGWGEIGAAAVLAALGMYLWLQVSVTPSLALQLIILGGCGVAAAAFLIGQALRDLRGRVVLRSDGVEFKLGLQRRSLAWSELACWEITNFEPPLDVYSRLKIWTKGSETPYLFPISWLSAPDRTILRSAFKGIMAPRCCH